MRFRWLRQGTPTTIQSRIRWLVIACVAPAWLLAVGVSYLSFDRERESLVTANIQTARSMAQSVERELSTSMAILQGLATSTRIDDGDLRRFQDRARQTLALSSGDNILLVDPSLRVLVSVATPFGEPLPQLPEDQFPEVIAGGKPAVSDLFVGRISKKHQVAVAVPVMRDSIAVARLEMIFSTGRFGQILERQALPTGWTAAVIDSKGVIVARNRSPEAYIGKSTAPALRDALSNGSEGSFNGRTQEGIEVIGCYSRSAAYGWAVAIGVPTAVLHARLRRTLLAYGVGAMVLLALGYLLAERIGRRISEPIHALVQPALAIGRGEDAVIAGSKVREAAELGEALLRAQRLLKERELARMEAVASLRDSQTRLRMALDASQIGDWDVDLRTNVMYHSLRHDQCFGYSEPVPDWNVQSFMQHVHPDDRPWVAERMQQLVRSGSASQMDCRVIWPDGSTHWIAAQSCFLSDKGVPYFMMGIVIDITDRKQSEELRLSAVRLEAENRQIQEANRLKSEFLANMSHELRTPLNAVIGFAEIMRSDLARLSPAKQGEYLGHIATSGRHLLRLINDVLDLSKVESGKLEFFPEPVDLPALISDVTGVLQGEAAAKSITLETRHDPELVEVVIDPGRLRQMLYNLLSNAIKFTENGGRVQVRCMTQGDDSFRIEVEDSGIGISEADQQKLFTQFQQIQSGYARSYQGTGLGLALTRRLAELQGGRVGVHSTPSVGSVFYIVLPRGRRLDPPVA